MQKVITVNLNGHPYHLEEAGHDGLREYLARAERDLEGNPDRAEIMADLEQAIADKCRRFLGAHKSVVTAAEVEQIIREMGPIDASAGESRHAGAGAGTQRDAGAAGPKRLYRIREGAMVAGICSGLAAYLGIDAAIVRLLFVVLTVFTGGAGLIVYLVLLFVMPEAKTPEEQAAAGGAPFNAQEVVDRAKQQYTRGARRMQAQWRRQQRQWRRQYASAARYAYPPSRMAMALSPVFVLVHLTLFLAFATVVISLVNTGTIFGWEISPEMPVWASVLILFVIYQIVVSPIRAGKLAGQASGPFALWNALIWIGGVAFLLWIASNNMPEVREFLHRVPGLFRDFVEAVRDFFTSRA